MSVFGWSYPPGAANDPSAPWNQPDPPEECLRCKTPWPDDEEELPEHYLCDRCVADITAQGLVICNECGKEKPLAGMKVHLGVHGFCLDCDRLADEMAYWERE